MREHWDEKVTVVLHHVPESEDYEGGFEAVTMTGVPYRVSVTGSDPDSAEGALNHLLDGFRAFGFAGQVIVEDATGPGRPIRYGLRTSWQLHGARRLLVQRTKYEHRNALAVLE